MPKWPTNSWLQTLSVKLRQMTSKSSGRQLIERICEQYHNALGRQVEELKYNKDVEQDKLRHRAEIQALTQSSRSRHADNSTELAQAFSAMMATSMDRCVRCRATFGYL